MPGTRDSKGTRGLIGTSKKPMSRKEESALELCNHRRLLRERVIWTCSQREKGISIDWISTFPRHCIEAIASLVAFL